LKRKFGIEAMRRSYKTKRRDQIKKRDDAGSPDDRQYGAALTTNY
jgi:hypothetical protein